MGKMERKVIWPSGKPLNWTNNIHEADTCTVDDRPAMTQMGEMGPLNVDTVQT